MQRDYHSDGRLHRADLLAPEEVGRIAAERTLARAGARRPRTGAFPVILEERVAASLMGHLVAAANGSAVARGASWLRDAMGEPVLPDDLTLVEDPYRPRVSSSRPFDAEGLPTRAAPIVEGGRLARWVLDLSTARRLGLSSTANAQRGTAGPPSPGTTGFALTQGETSLEEMLREMGTGLLVTSFIGSTVNPTTGDWSRGASGHWIENGERAYPVHECTLAGNLREMLRTIRPANDARPHLSRVVPSLLVEGLTLAGD
jgi:PmbA protein